VQLVGRSLRGKKFEVMSTFLRNSCTHQHSSIKKFNSVHNEAVRNCKYQISQQFLIIIFGTQIVRVKCQIGGGKFKFQIGFVDYFFNASDVYVYWF
jgi:hypothetical protein